MKCLFSPPTHGLLELDCNTALLKSSAHQVAKRAQEALEARTLKATFKKVEVMHPAVRNQASNFSQFLAWVSMQAAALEAEAKVSDLQRLLLLEHLNVRQQPLKPYLLVEVHFQLLRCFAEACTVRQGREGSKTAPATELADALQLLATKTVRPCPPAVRSYLCQ